MSQSSDETVSTSNTDENVNSAVCKAFAIPELLENIIVQLPIKDILLSQGVSKEWQNAIKASPNLQKTLFLHPEGIVKSWVRIRDPRQEAPDLKFNPLITQACSRFKANVQVGVNTFAKPDVRSLVDMFLNQPPCTTVDCAVRLYIDPDGEAAEADGEDDEALGGFAEDDDISDDGREAEDEDSDCGDTALKSMRFEFLQQHPEGIRLRHLIEAAKGCLGHLVSCQHITGLVINIDVVSVEKGSL